MHRQAVTQARDDCHEKEDRHTPGCRGGQSDGRDSKWERHGPELQGVRGHAVIVGSRLGPGKGRSWERQGPAT